MVELKLFSIQLGGRDVGVGVNARFKRFLGTACVLAQDIQDRAPDGDPNVSCQISQGPGFGLFPSCARVGLQFRPTFSQVKFAGVFLKRFFPSPRQKMGDKEKETNDQNLVADRAHG